MHAVVKQTLFCCAIWQRLYNSFLGELLQVWTHLLRFCSFCSILWLHAAQLKLSELQLKLRTCVRQSGFLRHDCWTAKTSDECDMKESDSQGQKYIIMLACRSRSLICYRNISSELEQCKLSLLQDVSQMFVITGYHSVTNTCSLLLKITKKLSTTSSNGSSSTGNTVIVVLSVLAAILTLCLLLLWEHSKRTK